MSASPLSEALAPAASAGRPLALVTGANNGFGYGVTVLLLSRGYDVILACRSAERGAAAAAEASAAARAPGAAAALPPLPEGAAPLHVAGPGAATAMVLDLADLRSVAAIAEAFARAPAAAGRLAVLINNAGLAQLGERVLAPLTGVELTVATNHLGHAALFNLLLPRLRRDGTRVVAVSSIVHSSGVQAVGAPLDAAHGWAAYCNSKLLNSLWAREVQRRFSAQNVTCTHGHPGSGLFTTLGGKQVILRNTVMLILAPILWLCGMSQTWHEGGIAELACAEAPTAGGYFYRQYPATASAAARDDALSAYVWQETQRLLAKAAAEHGLPAAIACAD